MRFSKRGVEAFVLKAEEVGRDRTLPMGVNVDDVSAALRLGRDEGRELAHYLSAMGWAQVSYNGPSPTLILTPDGFGAVERLRSPWWRRWTYSPAAVGVVSGVVSGVISSLVSAALLRLLLP